MHCDPNDPRLTAYALGELHDAERTEFEAHLDACEACRFEVARIRQFSGTLADELRREVVPPATLRLPSRSQTSWQRWAGWSAAMAACLFVLAGLAIAITQSNRARMSTVATLPPSKDYDSPDHENLAVESKRSSIEDESPAAVVDARGLERSKSVTVGLQAPGEPSLPTFQQGLDIPYRQSHFGLTPADQAPGAGQQGGQQQGAGQASSTPGQKSKEAKPAPANGPVTSATTAGVPFDHYKRGVDGITTYELSIDPFDQAPATPGLQVRSPEKRDVKQQRAFFDTRVSELSDLAKDHPQETAAWQDRSNEYQLSEMHRYAERQTDAETYGKIVPNPFREVVGDYRLSTFSIDVDTAAYANVRRYLRMGQLPPRDAVRVEELVNYFTYEDAPPTNDDPFAAHLEVADCPWNAEHRLVRIGLKGRTVDNDQRPASNLVFLLDVSGSMQPENKLPLVKKAFKMLVRQLGENDRVAIVVYASATGLVLPSTTCNEKDAILGALDKLESGGSTNGEGGIKLAYEVATQHFIRGGTNRVILCTDGDFNVGISDRGELVKMIEGQAKSGVFLTVLGFGMGNLKDATLEQLADKGNGSYGYVDTEAEARKLFVEQMSGTLVTIAKDVKIQVEFNPARVQQYRLIGYENRMLANKDFNDDTKDAGEIGAGHSVTALYEIVPVGAKPANPEVDPLKYQPKPAVAAAPAGAGDDPTREMLTLKLRYKQPDGEKSIPLEFPLVDGGKKWSTASRDFRFSAAVAGFGMLLQGSPYKGTITYSGVLELAHDTIDGKQSDYRKEFLELVEEARRLSGK